MRKQIRFAIVASFAAVLLTVPAVAQTAEEIAEKQSKEKADQESRVSKENPSTKVKDAMLQPATNVPQVRARTADQMQDPATPGPHHAHLAAMAGDWTVTTKLWTDPDGPPAESTGTVHNEMMLGGRFLESRFEGEMLGQPFKGLGIDGYDNVTKKHTSQWMDSAGTMVSFYEGSCSDGGKVITVYTEFNDPMTGALKKLRGTTTVVSADQYTYESATEMGGEYVKTMEAVFTRK